MDAISPSDGDSNEASGRAVTGRCI